MPGNKGKGGKKKRRCKNEVQIKRNLVLAEEDQAYGKVIKMLGNVNSGPFLGLDMSLYKGLSFTLAERHCAVSKKT